MDLLIQKTFIIDDTFSWYKYASPEGGDKQWKEGRSALEFARFMTSNNGKMPTIIKDYLKSIGVKDNDFVCIPEHVTKYDAKEFGKGEGRHHDGLLISDSCVIGIEAKVSESFDKLIMDKLSGAEKKDGNGYNMKTRIFSSLKLITGKDYQDDVGRVGCIMYQLVSATVGTILEAEKKAVSENKNKMKAVVLVIEFVGDGVDKGRSKEEYQRKIEDNDNAFNNYMDFLGINTVEKDSDRFKHIRTANGCEIQVWFKMMKINISKDRIKYTVE